MAEPVGPCRELFTVEGKEPLKYIWDHLEEFMKRGRKEIQAHVAEYVANKDNSEIIANAVWSCILEHGDEPESDNSRVEQTEEQTQHSQTELLPTKESEDLEVEKTTTSRAKELDSAEQPVTLEDIEAALDTGDRKKAVELWQIRQRALGKPPTHTALYDRAGEHKSDFYKWLKGNKPKGYSTDRALKEVLTTDWK